MNTALDRFLITTPDFYSNITENLAYAKNLGASKVYVRDTSLAPEILGAFMESCLKYDMVLFINAIKAYFACGVGGIHLKSAELARIDEIPRHLRTSYSAHSLEDIEVAYNRGVDCIFISPIFAVKDKGRALGVEILGKIPLRFRHKIYALGGINASNLAQIAAFGIKGVAGIRMFIRSDKCGES